MYLVRYDSTDQHHHFEWIILLYHNFKNRLDAIGNWSISMPSLRHHHLALKISWLPVAVVKSFHRTTDEKEGVELIWRKAIIFVMCLARYQTKGRAHGGLVVT